MNAEDPCAIYQKMFKTRPSQLGSRIWLWTAVLAPFLIVLTASRLLMFLVFNLIFVLCPGRYRDLLFRSDWVYRTVLFLTTGLIVQQEMPLHWRPASSSLFVINHHGVCDIFLLAAFERLGVTSLVVSYPADFYARLGRWFFFFYTRCEILNASQQRLIVERARRGHLAVFPEGAGKKAPVIFSFHPGLFRFVDWVEPCAVSYRFALPYLNAYGVDLPWHKSVAALLLMLTPWTVLTIRLLPPLACSRDTYREVARTSRDLIARAAGYEVVDFLFDQATFDACVKAVDKPR